MFRFTTFSHCNSPLSLFNVPGTFTFKPFVLTIFQYQSYSIFKFIYILLLIKVRFRCSNFFSLFQIEVQMSITATMGVAPAFSRSWDNKNTIEINFKVAVNRRNSFEDFPQAVAAPPPPPLLGTTYLQPMLASVCFVKILPKGHFHIDYCF